MHKSKNNTIMQIGNFQYFRALLTLAFVILFISTLSADAQSEFIRRLESFSGTTPPQSGIHCGFRDLVELRQQMSQMSPEIQGLAKSILFASPPQRQDSTLSPAGHFMLHFDRTGIHAVPLADTLGNGIPDYIDSAGVYLDQAWDIEINQLGFTPPPNRDGNPVEVYPVYFTSFGYYGLTTWIEPDIPGLPGTNFPSYMELHNDYEGGLFYSNGLEGLKVTCAHEFNHAIQLGYNFRLDSDLFMMEMTSTWLEDYVFDDVNDYVFYLDDLFRDFFRIGFTKDTGYYPYANSLFLHMIVKKFGPQIVPEIWNRILTNEAFAAIDEVLDAYGSSFAESQNAYAGWLYFTGTRARTESYFEEGNLYPELITDESQEAFDNGLVPFGSRLVRVDPEYNQLVGATVSSGSPGKFSHILDNTDLLKPVNFNARQILTVNEKKPVIVVMSNPANVKISDLGYSIKPQSVVSGPNPVTVNSGNGYAVFRNLPQSSTISLFNLNGIYINEIGETGNDEATWDLKDYNGKQVATGIYIYRIKADGFEKLGKISVVR